MKSQVQCLFPAFSARCMAIPCLHTHCLRCVNTYHRLGWRHFTLTPFVEKVWLKSIRRCSSHLLSIPAVLLTSLGEKELVQSTWTTCLTAQRVLDAGSLRLTIKALCRGHLKEADGVKILLYLRQSEIHLYKGSSSTRTGVTNPGKCQSHVSKYKWLSLFKPHARLIFTTLCSSYENSVTPSCLLSPYIFALQ